MKNVNIKKVVAGAAALAIAAGSLGAVVSAANVADSSYTTPNGLARADMFNAQGAPSYNIVVGSTGHASDVVWAANIAAAIGKKAYNVSTASATGGDVVVEVGAEGVTTVSGDGYLLDNASAVMGADAADLTKTGIRNRDYSALFDAKLTYRDHERETQTITRVKEELSFVVDDAYYESDKDVQEIIAKIGTGKLTYVLDLGNDIVFRAGGDDKLIAGGKHNIEIPFMGKKYNIRSITSTNDTTVTEIELVSNDDLSIYNQGQTFNVEDYSIEVGTITAGSASTENKVLLRLYQGTNLLKSESLESGDATDFGYLTNDIKVTDVQYASDQMGFIQVSMAEGIITLESGQMDDLTTDGREWEVSFGADDGKLKTITVKNLDGWTDSLDSDEFPALRIGDKAKFPGNLGSVEFIGLKEENRFPFVTQRSSSYTPESTLVLTWESEDASHNVPVYAERTVNAGAKRTMKVDIDGKEYWITYNDADGKVAIREINDDASTDVVTVQRLVVDTTAGTDTTNYNWCDITTPDALTLDSFIRIQSDAHDSIYHYYYLGGKSGDHFGAGDFGIALSPIIKANGDGDLTCAGATVVNHARVGTNGVVVDDTAGYKIADSSNKWAFKGSIEGKTQNTITDFYYKGDADKITTDSAAISEFVISDFTNTITALFDPSENRLANIEDIPTGNLRNYANAIKKVKYDGGAAKYNFFLNDYDSDELRNGITLSGAELAIDGKQLNLSFPEEKQRLHFFVGGGATTSTTSLGSEVTLTTPGEVVDADGIKVKLVSAPQGSATTYTPAAFGNIAYLDTDTLPAGNKIIVGGWMVNEQAKTLGLEDLITTAGDYVAGKNAQGNIVVAGFHKEDTANAAKELIAAIEAMN